MGLIKEFKEFAIKGSVMDLAVAVIIGAAFGKIVTSFVNDVLMPPIGVLLGGVDFKEYKAILVHAVGDTPAVTLNYGMFVQNIIDFLIIAGSIFLLVKALNSTKKKSTEAPAAPPAPSKEETLLTEIRDLLKEKK
ncbi:MAG TPA: large-conductance mechanosensitive channel protein MscL [Bacteroidales bacterium]|nr:large-conductance mechanosensitive channel protein MscL [Bacteroidales bacterium]HPT03255.1 large-conductance mechanosensitive channel protein MscL [Bacteroidales bacterium]